MTKNHSPVIAELKAGVVQIVHEPGQAPEKNVATLALTSFTAFLIGPPFIGIVASAAGLPVALALLAPLGAVPLLMPRNRDRAPAGA